MGVNSIGGQDLAALSARIIGQTPAPKIRSAEVAGGRAREARAAKPNDEQTQRSAEAAEAAASIPPTPRMRFRIDEATEQLVAQLVNENNEVIKQIPPEELLRIATHFRWLQGLLFDEQA